MNDITRIVLTGGPCAGKTTALAKIVEHFSSLGYQVFTLPEVPTMLTRFATPDPESEQYYPVSPYAYCAANPIRFTDPTGTIIQGASYADACLFLQDLFYIMSNSIALSQFWNTLSINESSFTFNLIPEDLFNNSILEMNEDEAAFATILYKTINSNITHTIEYYDEQISNPNSISLFVNNLDINNKTDAFYLNDINSKGFISKRILEQFNHGLTFYENNGTKSYVNQSLEERAFISCHEILGHGRAFEINNLRNKNAQQESVIRFNNLMLRLLGIDWIDNGAQHGNKAIVKNPSFLPILLF